MPLPLALDIKHVHRVDFLDEGLVGQTLDPLEDWRDLGVDLAGLSTVTSLGIYGQI